MESRPATSSVTDVAGAFVTALEQGSRLLANIGTGQETTVNQLFSHMASLTRFSEPAVYAAPRAGELRRSALDASLARETLGWTATTSLQAGLGHTLDWLRLKA
jgi:UDP-glucose 4-epimerase